MTWLNNVISDLQNKFFGSEEYLMSRNSDPLHTKEHQTLKKVQQFQARLVDLDRRLADLR